MTAPLVVVDGNATPEEVAALVAVLQGMAAAPSAPAPKPRRSSWADPARQHRTTSATSWRASALPR